jgi:hypothetical protein
LVNQNQTENKSADYLQNTARTLSSEKSQEVLQYAREAIREWQDFWRENRERANVDRTFLRDSIYTDNEIYYYQNNQKILLNLSPLPAIKQNIVAEFRKNVPMPVVKAATIDEADSNENLELDQERLDLQNNLLYTTLKRSNADRVFEDAAEEALDGGYAAWRIFTDYENPYTFQQTMGLEYIKNPDLVFFDANANEVDKSDGDCCGYIYSVRKRDFLKDNPDIEHPVSFGIDVDLDLNVDAPYEQDLIWICELYRKEYFKQTIVMLDDGREITLKEYNKEVKRIEATNRQIEADNTVIDGLVKKYYAAGLIQNAENVLSFKQDFIPIPQIIKKRPSKDYKIRCYKLLNDQVISNYTWPIKALPLFLVLGKSNYKKGKQQVYGFFHYSKDVVKQLSYLGSEIAEAIKIRNRAQLITQIGNVNPNQIEDAENAYLLEVQDVNQIRDRTLPPLPPDLIQNYERCKMDVQRILGRFDANLGAQGNETSGVAIYNRAKLGSDSTYLFHDNLMRSIKNTAQAFLDLIPVIHDSAKELTLMTPDGETQRTWVNTEDSFDLSKGKFIVDIDVNSNFDMQKYQDIEIMTNLIQTFAPIRPDVALAMIDLVAAETDMKSTPKLVERLRLMLPPQVAALEKIEQPPMPPNPAAQMQQQEMQLKQGELQLKNKQLEIEANAQKIKAREQDVQLMRIKSDQVIAMLNMKAEHTKANAEVTASDLDAQAKVTTAHSKVVSSQHKLIQELNKKIAEKPNKTA